MWLFEGSIFQPRTSRPDTADGHVEGEQSRVCSVQGEFICLVSESFLAHVAPCEPGAIPHLIPSLPHFLLRLFVSYTFPFLTRFIYFLAFPSLSILPE